MSRISKRNRAIFIFLMVMILTSFQLLAQGKSEVLVTDEGKYSELPTFIHGGNEGLTNLFLYNYEYQSNDSNVEGTIFLEFKVLADGQINEIKLIRGILPSLDQEAVRVLSLTSGLWKSGQINKENVTGRVVYKFVVLQSDYSKQGARKR